MHVKLACWRKRRLKQMNTLISGDREISIREHFTVWCLFKLKKDTSEPGYSSNTSVRTMYGQIKNPEMLLWLAEVVGVDEELIDQVVKKISNNVSPTMRCGLLRQEIPFEVIIKKLNK
ncbi:hypothetical protein [Lactiplantibacillus songbeiensis]|uniref:Uncharacterized protein n=1 Tax=Lactiplantibacillus songbeiensis TaxID=2559920 RepID=A0ABW4C1J5_9LACO|nr:hypothetical protein [Lactiplantibacillus songbeiensis]